MPMQKKANGANFKVSGSEVTIAFDTGGQPLVYAVCVWGPKPQFGGQRPKLWSTETQQGKKGNATVAIPQGMAMTGMQVTWSGGLIARGKAQGRLQVTVADGAESNAYSYDYSFNAKNETDSFYDGLNFA